VDDLNNSISIINLTNWFKARFNNTTNSSNDDLDYFRLDFDSSSEVELMNGEGNQGYGEPDDDINVSYQPDQMLVVLGFNITIDNGGSGSDTDSMWETSVGGSLNIEIADASVGTDQSYTINHGGAFSNVKINVSFDSKAELVRSAEKHIVSLSSELWTDYEIHDPGITIMELLCYAITDLEYRDGTNFAFDSFFDINVAGIFSPGGWGFGEFLFSNMCIMDQSYGISDSNSIWVSNSCEGEFGIDYKDPNNETFRGTSISESNTNVQINNESEMISIITTSIFSVTNPDPTTGGEDPEDPDTVRTRVWQSLRMKTSNRVFINDSVEQLEFAMEVTDEIQIDHGNDSLSRQHYFNGRFLSAGDLGSGSSITHSYTHTIEYNSIGQLDTKIIIDLGVEMHSLPPSQFYIDSFFDVSFELDPDDGSSVPVITSELSMNLTIRSKDSDETNEESYRVKVKFPWLRDTDDEGETFWARIGVLIGKGDFGSFFLPEVDDEVLVLFEQGDPRVPIVIGAIWNGKDEPPELPEDFEVEVEYAEESRVVLKTYFSVDGNNITLNEIIQPINIPGLDEYYISLDIDDLEAGITPWYDLGVDYITGGGSNFFGEIEEIIEIQNEDDHAETNLAFTITTYELILDPNTGREVQKAVAIDEIFISLSAVYEEDPLGGKSSEVKTMTLEVRVNRIEMA
jgi:hypothetical protein